jgi:hypothetical protein
MADIQRTSLFDSDRYRPRVWLVWPGGSEGRLWEVGRELRFRTGSEERLLRRSLPAPIVIGRRAVPPAELAGAVSTLTSEVLSSAPDSVIQAAASRVIQAMQQSGGPVGITFILLAAEISTGSAGSLLSGLPALISGATDSSSASQASDNATQDSGNATLAAVSTPTAVAGLGGALTAIMAAVTGFLSRSLAASSAELSTVVGSASEAASSAELSTIVGYASDLAWTLSGGFAILTVLIPSPTGVDSPPDTYGFDSSTDPDAFLTVESSSGVSVTFGGVTLYTQNADGSVTASLTDGTSVTVGPPSDSTGGDVTAGEVTQFTQNADESVTATFDDGTSVTIGPPSPTDDGTPGDPDGIQFTPDDGPTDDGTPGDPDGIQFTPDDGPTDDGTPGDTQSTPDDGPTDDTDTEDGDSGSSDGGDTVRP